MSKQADDQEQIIKYYDSTESDYELVLGLSKYRSLHYGFWDSSILTLGSALENENQIMANLAKITEKKTVLDAGCGVGGSAIYLSKKYGCKTIGITLSSKQVEHAKRNAAKSNVSHLCEFFTMDYTKTNFKNGTFDVVWAIESVCHANDKLLFLKEAHRLLKKGGKLILADGFFTRKEYTSIEKTILNKWLNGWGVDSLETEEDILEKSKRAGFRTTTFIDATKNIIPTAIILYFWSIPGTIFGKALEIIGLRNKFQGQNVQSAMFQGIALSKKLWKYGFVLATK